MGKNHKAFILTLAVALLSACVKPDPTPEPLPLDAPRGLVLLSCSETSVTIGWDAVEGADRYVGRLETAAGELVPSGQKTVDVTRISYTGLTASATYKFKVRAKSETSDSQYSQVLEFTTGQSAPAPQPPTPGGPEPGDGAYAQFKIPAAEDAHGLTLAFPGAEGGGMYTTGGRGGKVIHVTNLEDSGEGSFRAAVQASGARTIVFDVAGVSHLKSDLEIKNGNLTIAGQTAPGGGICVSDQTVVVKCSNVIIRYMRFRLGDKGNLGDSSDGIWGRYFQDIILDHCSISWAVDECASFYANKNFTMQWCYITEALRTSVHSKGEHGYGGIWGGKDASFHHNLLAHNDSRNARIDHPGVYGSYLSTHRGNVDVRNNVIYNWGSNSTYGGEDGHFNIVGNYYKPGPGSTARNYFVDAYWYNSSSKVGSAYPQLYITGNHHTASASISQNNAAGIYYHDHSSYGANPKGVVLDAPLSLKGAGGKDCYVTTHSAQDAFTAVLAHGGASLVRDAVDVRIAEEARTGTATYTGSKSGKKGIIDSPDDVGGWPEYKASADQTARTKDSDGDGMPDWFETQFGLKPDSASDSSGKTLDFKARYSNFEMYLHYLVKDITDNQISAGSYVMN